MTGALPVSPAQIAAAVAVVTRRWPDERAMLAALIEAVEGAAPDVADPEFDLAAQRVTARLNVWADQDHAALLSRLPGKRRRSLSRGEAVQRVNFQLMPTKKPRSFPAYYDSVTAGGVG